MVVLHRLGRFDCAAITWHWPKIKLFERHPVSWPKCHTARNTVSISFITEESIPASWSDRTDAGNKIASMLVVLVICMVISKAKILA